jgi:hypothetical protein
MDVPNETQIAIANILFEAMTEDPATFTAPYEETYFCIYHMQMRTLNHTDVIGCFEEALQDAKWPESDNAVKQQFPTRPSFNHNLVTKTEWDTTLFVRETEMSDDIMADEISRTSP